MQLMSADTLSVLAASLDVRDLGRMALALPGWAGRAAHRQAQLAERLRALWTTDLGRSPPSWAMVTRAADPPQAPRLARIDHGADRRWRFALVDSPVTGHYVGTTLFGEPPLGLRIHWISQGTDPQGVWVDSAALETQFSVDPDWWN